MKIYDCFTFFNEYDLLEIRLEELYDKVDYFVISEANKTHSGVTKEFNFEKNISRYQKYLPKIRYVKVSDMPNYSLLDKTVINVEKITKGKITRFIGSNFRVGKWKLEDFQRTAINRALYDCDPDDIIMVSDVDEIPRRDSISKIKNILKSSNKVGLKQDFFNYTLNGKVNIDWIGTKACKYSYFVGKLNSDPQTVRLRMFHYQLNRFGLNEDIKLIQNAGWHFNNVGKKEEVLLKMQSKSESEMIDKKKLKDISNNYNNVTNLVGFQNNSIEFIKIDSTFPKSVIQDTLKYSHIIKLV